LRRKGNEEKKMKEEDKTYKIKRRIKGKTLKRNKGMTKAKRDGGQE